MKKLLLFLFTFCFVLNGFSQKLDDTDKETFMRAEYLFKVGKLALALPLYNQLVAKYPTEYDMKFKLGVCYNKKNDEHEKAIPLLEEVLTNKPKTKDIDFELGRAYLYSYMFDKAEEAFKNHTLKNKLNPEQKKKAERYIYNCRNARELVANPIDVKIEPLIGDLNSEFSEYTPAVASDESQMVITYRGDRSTGGLMNDEYDPDPDGDYFEDVFISFKVGDQWQTPERIGTNINGFGYDAAVSISPSGQKLFLYIAYPEDGGDLYVAYLDGDYWTAPERLLGDVNTKFWEGSCSISADEKTLFFASERPGGLGGKDIYKASLKPDGTWGNVVSLGPNVNTAEDDDAPFIHPDGQILHFSSKGHNAIGEYDIFRADMDSLGEFGKAYNLGYPLNTPDDDVFYTLSADGRTGYFSSGRRGGQGQQDIYTVRPGLIGRKTQLALVKGLVLLNDTGFVQSQIEVYEKGKDNEVFANYDSNKKTGKFLLNLPAGAEYKIIFKYQTLEPQIKTINLMTVDSFGQAALTVKFYTNKTDTATAPEEIKLEVAEVPKAKVEQKIPEPPKDTVVAKVEPPKVEVPKGKKDYKNMPYEYFLKTYPDDKGEGFEYRVQIAAYRLSGNFNFAKLLALGTVDQLKWDDNITRFSMGKFSTFKEAEAFRQQVIAAGVKDAFVYGDRGGKRYFVWQLPEIFGER
ncbi:MAG: hypothetical protein V4667_10495 [Bacteroidota bacterium]